MSASRPGESWSIDSAGAGSTTVSALRSRSLGTNLGSRTRNVGRRSTVSLTSSPRRMKASSPAAPLAASSRWRRGNLCSGRASRLPARAPKATDDPDPILHHDDRSDGTADGPTSCNSIEDLASRSMIATSSSGSAGGRPPRGMCNSVVAHRWVVVIVQPGGCT